MLKTILKSLLIITLLAIPAYAQFGTGPYNKKFGISEFGGIFGETNTSGGGSIPNNAMTFNGAYMLFNGSYMTFTHS